MAENLKSLTFTNGDSISNLTNAQQWQLTASPDWANYMNDTSYNNEKDTR